ncbi:MAG: glycosyltransferase family 39 protein [Deltaproteobacteria bacterium]|nr:glycosyltransferase family 39 protein [Deltaproteobacteria bacterium]
MTLLDRLDHDRKFALGALLIVTLFGITVRLSFLTAPIADRQSWNQCSTATVIRNFDKHGFSLKPEWDVLDPGPARPNIEAEEAPIYTGVSAQLYRAFGPSHAWPRLLSILAMVVGGLYLFRLTARMYNASAAIFAVHFWHMTPYAWFFGRTIMSDPWMLACTIAAADYFHKFLEDDRGPDLAKAAVATSLAGLFKVFALHIGVLFALAILLRRGAAVFKDWRLYAFAVVALAPPLGWIVYASRIGTLGNVTEGVGASVVGASHLWTQGGMLGDPAFWMRLQSRVLDRAMTPIVSALAFAVLVFPTARRKSAYAWMWLASVMVYVVVMGGGNYEHNYYQLPFVAPMALLGGMGLERVTRRLESRFHPENVLSVVLIAFLAVSYLYVRNEYRMDLSSVYAGKKAAQYTEPGDLLVVLDPGSTRKNQVLYHADRRGWHERRLTPEKIEQYREWGADDVVICLSPDQKERGSQALQYLIANYTPLLSTVAYGDGRIHQIYIFSLKPTHP